jgi:hypothetical protein
MFSNILIVCLKLRLRNLKVFLTLKKYSFDNKIKSAFKCSKNLKSFCSKTIFNLRTLFLKHNFKQTLPKICVIIELGLLT